LPAFGDPLPAKLQRLVQPQRNLLVKGWQSENRGFGIGAFAYYRRVVEDEKNGLIDELLKTCDNMVGAEAYRETLAKARKEIQFTRAIEQIGEGVPDALRINGQNPLTLLHRAISRDLHKAPDEECLAAAQAIRIVLMELSERMSLIRKENSELRDAMTRLFGQGGEQTEAGK
jgi:hypothetical protein